MSFSRKKFAVIPVTILLVILIISLVSAVSGQENDEWEEVERTREEIEELTQRVEELESAVLEEERKTREVAARLEEVEKRLEEAEKELELAQENLDEVRNRLGKRVRNAYINGGFSYLEMLFNSDGLGDLVLRVEYLSRIIRQDNELIAEVREVREQEEQRRQEVKRDYELVEELYQEHRERQQNLAERREEKEEMLYTAKDVLEEKLARISTRAEAPPVYGVVIDNLGAARPQHGLADAQLMYEYEVEGNITRYLALFAEFPSKVGPVRSARVHSATLAIENDVLFVYGGAHQTVRDELARMGVHSVDAMRTNGSFFRDSGRRAPHNLYVNLSTLGRVPPPDRSEIKPVQPVQEGQPGQEFSLQYNNFTRITYRYNAADNVYRRYLNGQLHRDAAGKVVEPRNIILQYADYTPDSMGRPTAELIGGGKIDFYSNGRHFRGTWRKDSLEAPTRFYYQDGTEIEIPYGKTWIQVVKAR